MKIGKALVPALILVMALSSCEWTRVGIFDFVGDPLLPPLAPASGSYSQPLTLKFSAGDEKGGWIWYTTDPEAPPALADPWTRWIWADEGTVIISRPSSLRAFTAIDEFHFSREAAFSYEFAAPAPRFSPQPGGWTGPIAISLDADSLPDGSGGFSKPIILYSLDGSEPFLPFDPASPLSLDATNGNLSLRARCEIPPALLASFPDYAEWTPSEVVGADYWIEFAHAGLSLTVLLPDGTGIALDEPDQAALYHYRAVNPVSPYDFTVSVGNPSITGVQWSLNGISLSQTGNSLTVGHAGPEGHPSFETGVGLRVGFYNLSCMGTDSQGYWHSQTFSFSVMEAP